jgi:hypothetical protein
LRDPLPIERGVKSLEEDPRGAVAGESMPFPGRIVSAGETFEGARRMEPMLKEGEELIVMRGGNGLQWERVALKKKKAVTSLQNQRLETAGYDRNIRVSYLLLIKNNPRY